MARGNKKKDKDKDIASRHVHCPGNNRAPWLVMKRKNRVKNRVNRGTSWQKVMEVRLRLEMERKHKHKYTVVHGQQDKMNKSQPSLRITSCFMIWRMLIIKTRRSEKICFWSSPGPYSQVGSVMFHWMSFSERLSSWICCTSLVIFGHVKWSPRLLRSWRTNAACKLCVWEFCM